MLYLTKNSCMLDIQLSKLYVDKKAVWKVVFNQLTTFYATISCMNSCMALPKVFDQQKCSGA